MIKFRCQYCDKKIGVPDEYAGKRVKCPRCASAIVVPELEPDPEVEVATEPSAGDNPVDEQEAAAEASAIQDFFDDKIYCPHCGLAVKPKSKSCPGCDHPLDS